MISTRRVQTRDSRFSSLARREKQNNNKIQTMKTSNQPTVSKPGTARLKSRLAAIASVAMLALGTLCFVTPTHAGPPTPPAAPENPQMAELDQLAADFHGALSYGGNITAMMSLWADDSSITLNGVAHVGKPAVQAFFLGNGYFLNNWVSLAPEYKTQIAIHGNMAEISTQCVAVDLSASPMVVKSVIQVDATCEKIRGQWFFTSMNNTSGAPL
jgi:hypothetical protein